VTVAQPEPHGAESLFTEVDGLTTHYWVVGEGSPIVLIHGGEFGGSAELGWEYVFAALGRHHRVYAPDVLGYGLTAKVHDFTDFATFKLRHLARFCEQFGLVDVPFIGNSMGGNFLIRDAVEDKPLIPASKIVASSGGGPVPANEARAALVDYDGTLPAMRKVVDALFWGPEWTQDEAYVRRRYESSMIPGAWECAAAARLHNPGAAAPSAYERNVRNELDYSGVRVPILVMGGEKDKLKPPDYAPELAKQIPGASAIVMPDAGHCPQIETPDAFVEAVLDYIDR